MRATLISVACFSMLALAASASAQTRRYEVAVIPLQKSQGVQTVRISRAAIGSAPIRIWANAAIDPDCAEHTPGATLSILQPPAHGTATISDEPYYQAYPRGNPRSVCNYRKVPGHQAFYSAAAGYTGRDRVVLQGSSPDGVVRRIDVELQVR